jgi:drug/metabolite transporter (DMT)-like permease
MLAALLYLGAGLGLVAYRRFARAPAVRPARTDLPWLAGAVLAGGIAAPVLLMLGLTAMPASSASLLLTAEGVFTALLARAVFGEDIGGRIALGLAAILAGVLLLAWPSGGPGAAPLWPSLAVLAACLLWALDNNLTRRVSTTDATWLAALKGCVAGSVNLVLALAVGDRLPGLGIVLAAGALGLLSYGVSLVLYVVALRGLGSARTGAYFSVAPFAGATLAVVLGDPLTWQLIGAGALMGTGLWLHLTEGHEHPHSHPATVHRHPFLADGHHDAITAGQPHAHPVVEHSHPHYPDVEHRHRHDSGADGDVRPPP